MKHVRTKHVRAFTLVELLIVIVIVGLLIALLAPAASTAWDAAKASQCQQNLCRIWQAQNTRRTDLGETMLTAGGLWPALLAPYLEHAQTVLKCPNGPSRPEAWPDTVEQADEEAVASGVDASGEAPPGEEEPGDGIIPGDITFRMFARVTWSSYKAGQYLGTAFIDQGYGVKKENLGGGKWYYGVDDRSFFEDKSAATGNLDYADMRFHLWEENGNVTKMEFIGSDQITGQGSWEKFRFEVFVRDEMVSDDFVRDCGSTTDMASTDEKSGTGASGGWGGILETDRIFAVPSWIVSFDYGISKGTYDRAGRRITGVDPRLILILDYGKSVADYASTNPDPWAMFFTASTEDWLTRFGGQLSGRKTPAHYQALRHSGQANVLFCDGHVETLGPEDLRETSPLWRYTGR
jgi:prepilin-type processing-associated H-X9-DG protein/prepilin-type N-terminal cleavage/methylation domain-containing protein